MIIPPKGDYHASNSLPLASPLSAAQADEDDGEQNKSLDGETEQEELEQPASTDPSEHGEEQKETTTAERKIHSKYDMVKVKVLVEEHFYILSRYMISRTLKMIKVPDSDAVRIALHIKKDLVSREVHEIP